MNPLALLKWLPALFKFAGIAKWFTWIPGGQIIGIVGGLAGLVVSFFKWLLVDISDAFKEPQRLLVRAVCILGALVGGFYGGIARDADLVAAARRNALQWQTAHNSLLEKAKTVDAADKDKHQKALAAKLKAESDERAKIEQEKKSPYIQVVPVKPIPVEPPKAADTTAAQPDSVRPKPARKTAHCKNRGGESSVFGLQPVWGGSLPCKSI